MNVPARPALFLSLLIVPFTASAQQPFPTYADSGTWSVLRCLYGIGTYCLTETCTYADQDTLCGRTWSVFTWPTFGGPGIAYLRNEGQRTLMRYGQDCLDKEYVLYDFSMDVGDSVYVPLNMDLIDPDTTLFVLQAIDTVEILGVERRRFSLLFNLCNEGPPNVPMQWIEGIGSTVHPFYPVDCLCDFCEQGLTTLCYDSAGVQLYMDPFFDTCDTLITSVDELGVPNGARLQCIYDEASRSLFVSVDPEPGTDLSLVLLASDGRIVRWQGLANAAAGRTRMDVASLAAGVYVVMLTKGSAYLAGQRVVIAY
jgi:hypothetical protein